MDPTMQSPIRRTVPYSGGTQITLPSGPHFYSTKTWVGSLSQEIRRNRRSNPCWGVPPLFKVASVLSMVACWTSMVLAPSDRGSTRTI